MGNIRWNGDSWKKVSKIGLRFTYQTMTMNYKKLSQEQGLQLHYRHWSSPWIASREEKK